MVSGERQVLSLAPWNKHDLSMRSFADRYDPVFTDDTVLTYIKSCLLIQVA